MVKNRVCVSVFFLGGYYLMMQKGLQKLLMRKLMALD